MEALPPVLQEQKNGESHGFLMKIPLYLDRMLFTFWEKSEHLPLF
jgi:hypothetical protein